MTAGRCGTDMDADRIQASHMTDLQGPTCPSPRQRPYIWATWLPRLLTGENSCEWAIWFKAHHQSWERVPSDFDQAKWMLDHTALLNERIANWTVGGDDVDIEAQNPFELHGRTGHPRRPT